MSNEFGLLAIVNSAIAGAAGGAFNAMLARGQSKKFDRIMEWFAQLSTRLSALEAKADEDTITDLVHRAFMSATRDSRTEKLHLFQMILENAYKASLDDAMSRHFMSLADTFDVYHIQVLRILKEEDSSSADPSSPNKPGMELRHISERHLLLAESSGAEMSDITRSIVNDLVDRGLVRTQPKKSARASPLVGIHNDGLAAMQAYRLSPLGKLFVKHIAEADPDK